MTKRLAILAALLALLADQVSKWWLIGFLAERPGGVRVTEFFNLVQVWNRGVSFGMFNTGEAGRRWVLIALALVMVVGLWVWLSRTRDRPVAVAIGLVMGGALGNALDRLTHGAVADFFDFHLAGWHWPAFNVADAAILIGVGVLVIDALFQRPEQANR